MTWTCPMCRQEYVIWSSLCGRCDTIRHLMSVYSPEVVCDAVEKIFLIQRFIQKPKVVSGDEADDEDESGEYEKNEKGEWKPKPKFCSSKSV